MKSKRAYIIRTGKRMLPFDDPIGDVLIKETSLDELQQSVLSKAGFSVRYISNQDEISRKDYPCLLITDDVYFNAGTLHQFLRLSRRTSRSTRACTAKDSAFSRIFAPFHDDQSKDLNRFPFYYLKTPSSKEFQPVVIDMGEHQVPFNLPAHMRGSVETILPMIARPLVQLTHPLDLIFANIVSLHVRFAEALSSRFQRAQLVGRARSLRPSRLLSRMNRIGKGCDIHPTACLEGAEIGSRVQIGANAVVRMSRVGDGCHIGDGSVVKHSVLGAGSVLYDDLTLGFAVCYPETFLIHGPYHLSLFGRASAMFATILDDFRLDGKHIRLQINGKLVAHPFPFIGSFIGHRTRVAGGSIIAPGRSIPNDLLIFPSPNQVLTRIGDQLPSGVPLFIRNGELQVLSQPVTQPDSLEFEPHHVVLKHAATGG
jgi:carbonic anhydrase/acetyltransferase-like protein (isoleucine patch superfamily)